MVLGVPVFLPCLCRNGSQSKSGQAMYRCCGVSLWCTLLLSWFVIVDIMAPKKAHQIGSLVKAKSGTKSTPVVTPIKKYRGVFPQNGKWKAQIQVNHKIRYLGVFDNPLDAAFVYDAELRRNGGKEEAANFPEVWPDTTSDQVSLLHITCLDCS
jgi:hypothetical protein